MPDVRTQLVGRIRQMLALAQGAPRERLAQAEHDLDAARDRLARTRTAAEEIPRRARAERDRRVAEVTERYAARVAGLAASAAAAADREATGPATAAWSRWQPAPANGPPGALRVGDVRLPRARPVPALVPLLDRGHVHVSGDDPARCDAVIATVLLRTVGQAAPGSVRLIGYDPEHLGGGLAGFTPLSAAGLLTFVGPGGLSGLLDELVDEIRRINEAVLAGEHASLGELERATGRRPEPWRVVVLLGDDELSRHERQQLARVVRTGAACGIHLVASGPDLPDEPGVERVVVSDGSARIASFGSLPVHLDPPPPAALVTGTCRSLAAEASAGPAPLPLAGLLPPPDQMWREDSADGLTAPIGEGPQGRPVQLTLGDYPPHALIGGPSGTGKTNLIYAWIGSLAARYSPRELEFYLLDFKEGVSFSRFAQGRRDPSWLPHVRLVGINVNTDREFGLALLRFLAEELRRRADAAKRHEVTKLAELRAADPEGHWPRIVAVIDEFQVLLAGRDPVAREAVDLLEDLARRGRSQGIHLVLASQDVRGIEALWGRPALIAQFTLRIALPKALRILDERNDAAQTLPRYHAVINAESGLVEGNQIARIPDASDARRWRQLQDRLWRMRPPATRPARLFDGDAIPRLDEAPDFLALRPTDDAPGPVALLGEIIDVRARSAGMRLRRAPGRNLAVLGTRVDEACAVLDAAARSLFRQHRPGTARFSIACLDPDADTAARALYDALAPDAAWYDEETVDELLAETAADLAAAEGPGQPHYLFLYAVDAAAGQLAAAGNRAGLEHLRRILNDGPERRTHVLAWWRGVARLRQDLGGPGARTDQIGAWVALDVQGAELNGSLYPGSGGADWYPRRWRGLFFDRTTHRTAQTVIPYGPCHE
jgi:hypothetical protein